MKRERNKFIKNIDVDVARETFYSKLLFESSVEVIPIEESLHRVTYEAVFANNSSPNYNASAMDGIAVVSENTYEAQEVNPVTLVEHTDFLFVNTGNMLPTGYDAVIMIEDVIENDEDTTNKTVQIIAPASPWQHVRPIGEDIIIGEMILPRNREIRAIDLGALISGGITEIAVHKKIEVGILPTGSELIVDPKELGDGKILDSNSLMIKSLVEECGAIGNRLAPCVDDYDELKATILEGIRSNDVFLINAGSSAGTKDYTASILAELGEVVIHGVATKPGKPTILAVVENKPVIGIPGYPVSSYFVFETFVKDLILKLSKQSDEPKIIDNVTLVRRVVSSLQYKEYVRVVLGEVDGEIIATPLARGAGVTMSLVRADAVLTVEKNCEGVEIGEKVSVRLLKNIDTLAERIVSIGSHDIIMDILSDMVNLSSSHVGSTAGLYALKQHRAHIAPTHLLDEKTGEYNVSYVEKLFPNEKMVLIKGVKRNQGLMVPKGNPKNITKFEDIAEKNAVFINRQRGSGTRVLLDYNLKKLGIKTADILSYNREVSTHMEVGISVQTGSADVGLGVKSAAYSLGLDFVPLCFEDYDFLVYESALEDERIIKFIEVLKSDEFKEQLVKLHGYRSEDSGTIVRIG